MAVTIRNRLSSDTFPPCKFRPRTLKSAAEAGDLEAVKYHLDAGADINGTTAAGHYPLGGAIINGHLEVVQFLLEAGAEPNRTSTFNWTPLYLAAWQGQARIATTLLRVGARLDTCTIVGWYSPDRWTALHVAADRGYLAVVRVLVQAGARIDCKDGNGRAPLDLALLSGHRGVATFLKSQNEKSAVRITAPRSLRSGVVRARPNR